MEVAHSGCGYNKRTTMDVKPVPPEAMDDSAAQ